MKKLPDGSRIPPHPELLAPAGNFSGAVHAFREGADAVYLGLPRFSARKNAVNFSLDELARLRTAADEMGKKIYIAANTVFREQETGELLALLYEARLNGADALIVQDYGLARLIRRYFPDLPLHASTQMAVHNAAGVRALKKLGFSRIILARELGYDEILKLRRDFPDTEFETFIHGALCYGFSGLCLASGYLLGRSGNRGECAQICRTWFERNSRKGYYFSTNDLSLEEGILELGHAGITSFKIEGRMKSPEYAGLAASYYRSILDGLPEDVRRERLALLRTEFSRRPTRGFFRNRKGDEILNTRFTGHIGIPAGIVTEIGQGGFGVRLSEPLSVRDGILFFGGGTEPVRMRVDDMFRGRRRITDAAPGEEIVIRSGERPEKNETIRKISSHSLTRQEIRPASWKPHAIRVPVDAVLTDSTLNFTAVFPVPQGLPRTETAAVYGIPVQPETARTRRDFREPLAELLEENGEYPFKAVLSSFRNDGSRETESVFIPPSVLKKGRQELYRIMDDLFSRMKTGIPRIMTDAVAEIRFETAERPVGAANAPFAGNDGEPVSRPPGRELLVPASDAPVPFVTGTSGLSIESLPLFEGKRYLPLAPVLFDEETYFTAIRTFLADHPDERFLIGLNNAAHLERARDLESLENSSFFIDYGLYCANLSCYLFFTEKVNRLAFVYFNIEGTDEDYGLLEDSLLRLRRNNPAVFFPPLVKIGSTFRPPLFISRICSFRHAFGESCRGCLRKTGSPIPEASAGRTSRDADRDARNREFVEQNGKRFRIVSRNCITYMIPSSEIS